jgi:DNA-binding beta-propeller fold protein YncE
MKLKLQWLPATLAIILTSVLAAPASRADGPYHLLKEIPVGGDGGWDILSVDTAGRRLYVSHGTVVAVIDIDKNEVAGQIEDTPGVHGFAIAPELELGFSSNGKENKVSIVDLKTLKTTSKVDTGENPDEIIYDSASGEVYAFNGRGHSATVIDAKTGKVTATIDLPGKPEFAVSDPAAGRVFCNIEDKSEVVAIDTKTHQVVNTWPAAPGEEPSGLAMDTANHRLFLGCGNKMMVMMDSTNGKVIANVPIGQGVDGTAFDQGTLTAFSSCGDGTTTIAHEVTPDKLTTVQTLPTEPRARTMTVDPKTHRIYLPCAKFEAPAPDATASPAASAAPAATGTPAAPGGQRQRPKMIPGSFKILVYGTEK